MLLTDVPVTAASEMNPLMASVTVRPGVMSNSTPARDRMVYPPANVPTISKSVFIKTPAESLTRNVGGVCVLTAPVIRLPNVLNGSTSENVASNPVGPLGFVMATVYCRGSPASPAPFSVPLTNTRLATVTPGSTIVTGVRVPDRVPAAFVVSPARTV